MSEVKGAPTEAPAAPVTPSTPAPATAAPVAPSTQATPQPQPPKADAKAPAAPTKTLLGDDSPATSPKAGASEPGKPGDYALRQPEGASYDPEVFTSYGSIARELGLPADKAQTLLDKLTPVMQAREQARLAEVMQEFSQATQADPEFGGEKFAQNRQVIARGIQALGVTPALKDILNRTGWGNHPEFVRVFYRAGLLVGDDNVVGTQSPGSSPAEKHPATLLYDNKTAATAGS